jgi:nicotinate phosphoribosyltransferase
MLESYLRLGMFEPATFSLQVRSSPARPWIVAAGLDLAIEVLDQFRFGEQQLAYLNGIGLSAAALDWLGSFRASGELWAVEPGTVLVPGVPLLELTAPLPVAQLLEAALLNALHYETLVATKAARCVLAAAGRPVIDFGFRRAPGLESGVRAALAGYIGGVSATSNVEAGRRFGIPVAGTMAHSFVMAFGNESSAFREFALDHPDGTTLLVDTYDTERGVQRAIEVIRELAPRGVRVRALRLDCEPLLALSRSARAQLDAAGLSQVELFASGSLDEQRIAALLREGAPLDAFGVGSALVASSDAAALDMAYKLVEYAGQPRAKYSAGKLSLPGRKQIFRTGSPARDVLELRSARAEGIPLLSRVWRDGEHLWQPDVERARARARSDLAALPPGWPRLPGPEQLTRTALGPELTALAAEVRRRDLGQP